MRVASGVQEASVTSPRSHSSKKRADLGPPVCPVQCPHSRLSPCLDTRQCGRQEGTVLDSLGAGLRLPGLLEGFKVIMHVEHLAQRQSNDSCRSCAHFSRSSLFCASLYSRMPGPPTLQRVLSVLTQHFHVRASLLSPSPVPGIWN